MHGWRRGKSTESVRECFLAPAPNDTMKKQSRERNPAYFKRVTSLRFFFLCMTSLKPCKELFFLNSCSNLVNRCERWSKVKKQHRPSWTSEVRHVTREGSPYNRCNPLITADAGRWMPYFMILFLEKRENFAKATWKCGSSESKFNLISGRLKELERSGIEY